MLFLVHIFLQRFSINIICISFLKCVLRMNFMTTFAIITFSKMHDKKYQDLNLEKMNISHENAISFRKIISYTFLLWSSRSLQRNTLRSYYRRSILTTKSPLHQFVQFLIISIFDFICRPHSCLTNFKIGKQKCERKYTTWMIRNHQETHRLKMLLTST